MEKSGQGFLISSQLCPPRNVWASQASDESMSGFKESMKRRVFLKGTAAAAFASGLLPKGGSALPKSPHLEPDELQNAVDNSDDLGVPEFFYKPRGGRVGDVIPFFSRGQFRIFHLYKADGVRYDTTWHQVSTDDFVHFTELGEMLGAGRPDDQDRSVATGSVIESSGRYHAFYTGFNTPRRTDRPEQGILHAVSDDLVKWQKIPADTFYAPEAIYERDDWRDPFVFWNDEAGEYWMLVAARLKTGPKRRRGCTALCTSKDLTKWEVKNPFWSPGLYYTHECPDLFRMGDWWYLVFSEFSESSQTRYRMSRNMNGPWITPEIDTFDTRALYAAKTASNGKVRFLFGWNPLRTGGKDDGDWEWGGNLVVHQLGQQSNGELYVTMPETIDRTFARSLPLEIKPALGRCDIGADSVKIHSTGSFGVATVGLMPARCKFVASIDFTGGCQSFGVMLKLLDDLDTCYYVRFEPPSSRIVFDRWPRPGDIPYMTGLERSLKITPGDPIDVQIIVDGTIAEVYIGGKVAMSARMYSPNQGRIGIFVDEGSATFKRLGIYSIHG
jgi:beta-fructofuranosidase